MTTHAEASTTSSSDDEEYAKFASVAVDADDVRRQSMSHSSVNGGGVPEGVAKSVSEALWRRLDTGIEFGIPSAQKKTPAHHPMGEGSPGLRLFRRGPTVKGDGTPLKEEPRKQRAARAASVLPKRRQIDHESISARDIEPLIVLGPDIIAPRQNPREPSGVSIPKAKKRRMLRNNRLYNTPIDIEEYS